MGEESKADGGVTAKADAPICPDSSSGSTVHDTAPKTFGRPSFIIPAFSGLRGVAALGVVHTHAMFGDGAKAYLAGYNGLTEVGHVAVVFFFVLSAYLLTLRALSDRQHPRDAKYFSWSKNGIQIPYMSVRWIGFFIRRVFRVFPTYIFVLLLAAAVPVFSYYYADFRDASPLTFQKMLNYIIFYDVNNIFWTIPPEFEYYLCVPLIVVLYEIAERRDKTGKWIMGIHKPDPDWYPYGYGEAEGSNDRDLQKGFTGRLAWLCYSFFCRLFMVIVLSIICIIVVPLSWANRGNVDYFHVPGFIARFWCGSLAAIVFHMFSQYGYYVPSDYKKSPSMSPRVARGVQIVSDILCWLIIISMVLSFPWYRTRIFQEIIPEDPNWYASNMGNLPEILSALLVFLLAFGCRAGTFANFFSWSFFTWAGDVSFPLYLSHPPIINFLYQKKVDKIDGLIILYALCILVATLIHYLIEKRGIAIGTYFARCIKKRYFSSDPAPAVDIEKFEESEIDKYKQDGKSFATDTSMYYMDASFGADYTTITGYGGGGGGRMRQPQTFDRGLQAPIGTGVATYGQPFIGVGGGGPGIAGAGRFSPVPAQNRRRTLVNFSHDEIKDVIDRWQTSAVPQPVQPGGNGPDRFGSELLPYDSDDLRSPHNLTHITIRN